MVEVELSIGNLEVFVVEVFVAAIGGGVGCGGNTQFGTRFRVSATACCGSRFYMLCRGHRQWMA